MKTLTKTLIVASVVGTVGLGGIATAGVASAESNSSTGSVSNLIDKIASTFDIDKDKLQTLFDEERESREADRETRAAERLQGLVDDGTITAAQKTAIEAKIKEMKAEREENHESMKDLSDEERKAMMDEKKTELEEWAKEQGLDIADLRGILGGHGGPGGHMGGPRM